MIPRHTIELSILGWTDSLILMVMALVVFGPRRLPEIGRQIGKLMYEFRKASNDFKFQMEEELRLAEEADRRKKQEVLAAQAPAAATAPALPEAAVAIDPQAPASLAAQIAEISSAPAEENAPHIQPPSTGEPIPAAQRSFVATEARVEDSAPPPEAISENPETTEQAQHG